jgi:hypothetical protein
MLKAKAPASQKEGKLESKLNLGHQTPVVKKKTQQMEPQKVSIIARQSHKKPYYQQRPKELVKAEEIIESSQH